MTTTSNQLEIEQLSAAVAQYAGTDFHRLVLSLLDSLRQHQLEQLVDVTPEELQHRQGALRQVRALRRAFETGDPPLV